MFLDQCKNKVLLEVRMNYRLGGDDVTLFFFMKPSNPFDRHIIRLRGARGENDILCVCTDEICNMLREKIIKKGVNCGGARPSPS